MTVTVQLNPQYRVNGVSRPLETLRFLKNVAEVCVVENGSLPELGIVVNDRMIGLVDPYDEWEMTSAFDQWSTIERIEELKPLVIFKYQWRRGGNYPHGTISAGLGGIGARSLLPVVSEAGLLAVDVRSVLVLYKMRPTTSRTATIPAAM